MIIGSMPPPKGLPKPRYFFDAGIRFECQRCGACCTGEPGTIYAAVDEIDAIAAYLDISTEALKTRYGYPYRDSISFREEADGRCCFYENGCRIYPVRPRQCSTYPFWFDIMRSKQRWQKAACHCPGVGRGRRFSREEILTRIEASYPESKLHKIENGKPSSIQDPGSSPQPMTRGHKMAGRFTDQRHRGMQPKRTIVDASSAILLAKTHLFGRLTETYRVVMAEAVYREINRNGYPGARRFAAARDAGAIQVLAAGSGPEAGAESTLSGCGERETIRLFSGGKGDFIVIDDRKGAAFCRDSGIPYINALLFPRILMLSGKLSDGEYRTLTERLLGCGRYSQKIAAVAAGASRERLGRFLPS
ncbi:MAG: YkgJ family cysteine cluster protein [Desulfobacterales bacterium]|nr:YkgJ family cysteine cluster protein [Desulfobacterales bacterium]